MSWLGAVPLLVATIAIGCDARALDANHDAGRVSVGVDGGVDSGGGRDLRDAVAIEFVEGARCGDGILDPLESCDDGNQRNGDGCNDICRIECNVCGVCGPPEPCHIIEHGCGDGLLEAGEMCDDGNSTAGDGCSTLCQIPTGWRCPAVGRPCVPICGDGLVGGRETCDDGNTAPGDGCSDICVTEPTSTRCGDGVISGAEECDNGSSNSDTMYDGCTTGCRFGPFCGDGVLDGLEECDYGRANYGYYGVHGSCTPYCSYAHFCGDGVVDEGEGEQCDLGPDNGVNGQLCTVTCKVLIDR